jgi:hypothetical protein
MRKRRATQRKVRGNPIHRKATKEIQRSGQNIVQNTTPNMIQKKDSKSKQIPSGRLSMNPKLTLNMILKLKLKLKLKMI